MSNKEGESMQQDLSNARIIEWESTEERGFEFTCLVEVAHVARREARGATFREGGTYYTEQQAAELGARVVAEFPAPSLAEIVGDAPAFRATYRRDQACEECLVVQVAGGWWVGLSLEAEGVRSLFTEVSLSAVGELLDVASVVPLFPREVVS